MQAIADLQKQLDTAPAIKKLLEQQRVFGQSSTMQAIADLQKRLAVAAEPSVTKALDLLGQRYVQTYEAARRHLDRHWADRHTENPDHPHPVLFVVASLPMALGYPIYEAAKHRRDDTALLALVEPVLTDAEFVSSVKAAVADAQHINPLAKEQLETALDWLRDRRYVRAYPPFYNGLEAALYSVARARGVIDRESNFVGRKGKAKKADDLLPHLVADPRYRRYLRAWIFGDVGNPFRHGDVDDVEDCRRQSLRLAIAVIGWLEIYGGWTSREFAAGLSKQARVPPRSNDNQEAA